MTNDNFPKLELISSPDWTDYELLDSGGGKKLERFGPYRFVRPESQAVWRTALPAEEWDAAHLVFQGDGEGESQGWETRRPIEPRWEMRYKNLKFWAMPTPFRHMGVFPEQAGHWDWIGGAIRAAGRPIRVLSLFGYTGLATLAAAAAGAAVTHVDASKKAIGWARDNQALSGLTDKPVRWILDDAMKFVRREVRRKTQYDAFIMDPPKFGRGPKGEIWKLEDSLPELLANCRALLSPEPLFMVMTVYSHPASALSIRNAVAEFFSGRKGRTTAGETVLAEKSAGRILSTSVFGRWSCAPLAD
ncbi:class I SAM-dependent methyltransferase [bacterium]|nr:class I SAM-dependent methyltransferase [bacterium]